jgi:D-amino-acid dehydrogenase
MKVVVIGAGVVGLCCAYELQKGGADVVVVERGRVGGGVSRGNTGWVCPSFTYPLPSPGIIGEGLRGMLHGDGALVLRPSLDPTFVRWLWQFRRSCSRARWTAGVSALLALNARTLELFDAYGEAGVEFEMHASGLLLVARTQEGLASYVELFRELRRLGFSGETAELGPEDARTLEPSLSVRAIAGGVHARIDRYVRPESLTEGLVRFLRGEGLDLLEETEVTGMSNSGGLSVETRDGPIPADRIVLAAGPSSRPLLERLRIRMPLVGARGYSLTIGGAGARPRHALYLAEAKVGISSFEDSVRIAGVFELGRGRDTLDRRRLAAMVGSAEPYFEDWRPSRETPLLEWAGLRPMTADGLPLIGRAPAHEHVFVATGHGMLGVTLGPATGAALAPLVLEGREPPELAPFRPDRSRRGT